MEIRCPNCNHPIELTESLTSQVRADIKAEYESKYTAAIRKKEAELVLKARKTLELKYALDLKDLKQELEIKSKKIEQFARHELELRQKTRQLEESKKQLNLELERKLDQERQKIEEAVGKRILEEKRFQDAEKDKKITDMLRQIDELKRKGQQGSQQSQGEVLELDLEDRIKQVFPLDRIEEVPKGIRGADVVQRVINRSGVEAGVILWESKRTKAWSDDWTTKLKDDQRAIKANISILVSDVLPKSLISFGHRFGHYKGVWVSDYNSMLSLARALRSGLIETALALVARSGKEGKMEELYNYLTSPEFRQKIESVVETFVAMQSDLEREKRVMERIWAVRTKQIERMTRGTSQIYGDIQGIAQLSPLETLELDSGDIDQTQDQENPSAQEKLL